MTTDKPDDKSADKTPAKKDTPKSNDADATASDSTTAPDESKLRTIVRNILAELTGDGDDTKKSKDDPADVAAQVRAELANVRKGESAEAERRAILDRLTKLEKSTEKEDAPVLYRAIERFMGWRLKDE